MRCWFGIESHTTKGAASVHDRSTLCAKYFIKEMVEIFHNQYGSFFG